MYRTLHILPLHGTINWSDDVIVQISDQKEKRHFILISSKIKNELPSPWTNSDYELKKLIFVGIDTWYI